MGVGPRKGCNSCDNSSWPMPGKFQHAWQGAFHLRGNADGHDCCLQSVQPVSPRLSWSQSRSATPSAGGATPFLAELFGQDPK